MWWGLCKTRRHSTSGRVSQNAMATARSVQSLRYLNILTKNISLYLIEAAVFADRQANSFYGVRQMLKNPSAVHLETRRIRLCLGSNLMCNWDLEST
jgi:hypothetical protein